MMKKSKAFIESQEVNDYISRLPSETQIKLQEIRHFIQQIAPHAKECMNYGVPTYKLSGNLVHFGGFKKHIGFYPGPSAIKKFEVELKPYKFSKGSVQFPLGKSLPVSLIKKMVKFRVQEERIKDSS